MKRVVLVLELTDDEADLVTNAVSDTKVRFGGLSLSGLLEAARAGSGPSRDGTDLHHAISEGAVYLGGKPLALESIVKELR